jgi:hypothetical protein
MRVGRNQCRIRGYQRRRICPSRASPLGAFRTPWVVRKLRKSSANGSQLPAAYVYDGSPATADQWAASLVEGTGSFTRPSAGVPVEAATARWRRHRIEVDPVDVLELAANIAPGGGGSWLDGFALVILAAIAALVVLIVAVPLGLIAGELALTVVMIMAGVVARLVHVKPWTVLLLRDGAVVATVAVKGWRSSRAMIAALLRCTC